jgi:SagB-type dehydrogenase family enzyme
MSARPLTLRLEGGGALVSTDDGDSWPLDERAAAHIRDICGAAAELEAPAAPMLSAATRGALAEAQAIRPVTSRHCSPAPSAPLAAATHEPLALGPLVLSDSRQFRDVLESRRSERKFEPPSLAQLATVLVRAGRLRGWRDAPQGAQEETRALPSAGACHPIELHVLTSGVEGLPNGRWAFDPLRCSLQRLDFPPEQEERAFPPPGFTLPHGYAAVFAVAHFQRTLRRYPAGASLVWRDAGVVLAGLHLCASDLGLASCIVATTATLGASSRSAVVDLGSVLLGQRPLGAGA